MFGIRLGTMMFAFIIIVGQLVIAFGGFLDRLWVMEVSLFLILFNHIIELISKWYVPLEEIIV